MNWYRIGSYIWTANSAGWLVIAYVTDLPAAFVVSVLCIGGTWAFNGLADAKDAE